MSLIAVFPEIMFNHLQSQYHFTGLPVFKTSIHLQLPVNLVNDFPLNNGCGVKQNRRAQ